MKDTGYSEELENLMEQYGDEIKRFCTLQLRDPFQAEDAAQDTFVKAWKALDKFRNESSQKTWLMHIAVNTCRDYQRTGWFRHTDRRVTPEDLPEQGQEAVLPDGEISRAIMSLPFRLRQFILLRYFDGLSLNETATAAGVSLATAKRQISKANQLLHDRLEGWYYDE
ncbi:MAG: sigma-70 family RNA polymerase sigma factor [Clostridia bacterium]|nr:sigma-70 family RNA polymerase sigma factor [Clostridia bacterium]